MTARRQPGSVTASTRLDPWTQGALGWHLLHSMSHPERFIEQIIDESWTEHLRRFDRVTADDVALRDRKLAFHQGKEPPVVRRYFSDSV